MNRQKIISIIIILIILLISIIIYNSNNTEYIVSITTIPSRIKLLEPVIQSFLNQNIGKPKKIIINIPNKYNRFPNEQVNIPSFFNKYHEIYVNRLNYDYGPATKVLGLNKLNVNPNTIILVTDDDNIKKSNWAKILINNIKQNPKSVSSIHIETIYGKKVHGGRGFGFYKKAIDIRDIIDVFFKVKGGCLLVDDDLFTNYCKYKQITINHITNVYPLYPESNSFKDKLKDLNGMNKRDNLEKKCYNAFINHKLIKR